jgi:hypothetical protein
MKRARSEAKQPVWKKIAGLIAMALLVGGYFLGLAFPFLILFAVCFLIIVMPGGSKRFYRTENRLATSVVRSVAMGLAELRGKVVVDTPMRSPLDHVPCAGYVIVTEDEGDKDDNGRVSYHEVSRETFCNDFRLADATGEIDVIAEGITLFDGQTPDSYELLTGRQRRGEIVLPVGADVFLIGDAAEQDGRTVMRAARHRGAVFGVQLARAVETHRVAAPLLRVAAAYAVVLALIGVGILSLNAGQMMQLHLPNVDTYEQMAAAGGIYRLFAWLYRNHGAPIPFMAAFGLMGAIVVLLFASRLFLPRGARKAVQWVLAGMLVVGVIAGAVPTMILVLAGVDPVKTFLIWLAILLGSALFSLFQQRGLRALANDMLKSSAAADGGSSA